MSDFDRVSKADQERIMEIVAQFHYRNGEVQHDGSWGVIKITLMEFNDALAKILLESENHE